MYACMHPCMYVVIYVGPMYDYVHFYARKYACIYELDAVIRSYKLVTTALRARSTVVTVTGNPQHNVIYHVLEDYTLYSRLCCRVGRHLGSVSRNQR